MRCVLWGAATRLGFLSRRVISKLSGASGKTSYPAMAYSVRLAFGLVAFSFLDASVACRAETASWPQWRGPDGNGSTPTGKLPTQWDASHLRWKAPLPGKGSSTPIVWNERIYVTAPIDGQDALLAFDWSGKQLWQTRLGGENAGRHRNGSGSNPSPITDGTGVFVMFKSG